jgi:hypothetical protein
VNLKTENSNNVSGVTVEVTGVETKYGVTGTCTFYLLDGSYTVKSSKGTSLQTNTAVGVGATDPTILNVACSDLVVNLWANNLSTWPMSGVTVEVTGVETKYGVTGSCTFYLLDGTYTVKSSKGTSSRTDPGVVVGVATTTKNVPVARFLVKVLKADFTGQTGVTVEVTGVETKYGVNTDAYFSLLASSPLGGTGAGQYTFKAQKGATIAQTIALADQPPALAGVIFMIP